MFKLSIIIPVYKVEAYLEKCIRSLQEQDIPSNEYELIIINDGSPDKCKDIALRLQQEFQNIVLIDQENQGVSMARNNAIVRARGEYILPIDPDDFVIPRTFKGILNRATRQNLDVLYLGFTILDELDKPCWSTNYASLGDQVFSGVDGYFAGRAGKVRDPDRSWAVLYKTSLLKSFSISYPKDVPYLEDGLFVAKVFAVADKCGYDNRPFYQRTTRAGSATHSRLFYSEKALNGFIKAAVDIREFRQHNRLSLDQSNLVNHVISQFVLLPIISTVGDKSWSTFQKFKPEMVKAGFDQLDLMGCRSIYQQYARQYNRSKNWFFFYFTWQSFLNSIKYRMGRLWPTVNKAD